MLRCMSLKLAHDFTYRDAAIYPELGELLTRRRPSEVPLAGTAACPAGEHFERPALFAAETLLSSRLIFGRVTSPHGQAQWGASLGHEN
jgi:hypothetical protein